MYNKVIHFNNFGAGDIFESREFVKALTKIIPADEYYYAHGKHPRILLDIPELKFMPIDDRMNPRKQVWEENGNLFVNTWIGITGKYLLPGIGCTLEGLFRMYNDILSFLNMGSLPGSPIDYLTDIDYSIYNTYSCSEFISQFLNEDKILIDNGLVQSMQATNFEFIDIIESVAGNYGNKLFIVTHPFISTRHNIFSTNDIIRQSEFDLPEISYLSIFCSTLIGRNSGPHVFTQVRYNVMNESKKLLSFTHHPQGSSFVVNTPVKIKKFWSGSTDKATVIRDIEGIIG